MFLRYLAIRSTECDQSPGLQVATNTYGGEVEDLSAVETWRGAVRAALAQGDPQLLGELFAGAQVTWGEERASRLWLETVSAFDANAVTG